ncbi:MAG: SGNH/GDSL hydrolase family protein [Anaerolineales bacterium]
MPLPPKAEYLLELDGALTLAYPDNRLVNIVCHGHSVPAGYLRTPVIDPFAAYPHRLHRALKEKYPFAALNVIVTAKGAETSEQGAARFEAEVLCHRPDLLTIDYGLNDRVLPLARARAAWSAMIEQALGRGAKVILMTPTLDNSVTLERLAEHPLTTQAEQIRALAAEYGVGLADSLGAWAAYCRTGPGLNTLLSQSNHPTRLGHDLVVNEIVDWFPMR